MSFVYGQDGPGERIKFNLILEQDLVCGEKRIKFSSLIPWMNPLTRSYLNKKYKSQILVQNSQKRTTNVLARGWQKCYIKGIKTVSISLCILYVFNFFPTSEFKLIYINCIPDKGICDKQSLLRIRHKSFIVASHNPQQIRLFK